MRHGNHHIQNKTAKTITHLLPISLSHPLIVVFTTLNAHAEPVNFSREVLPILSEHCTHCHGPDEKARKPLRTRPPEDRISYQLTKSEAVRNSDGKQPVKAIR